jgi:hypothetical protein
MKTRWKVMVATRTLLNQMRGWKKDYKMAKRKEKENGE